MNLSEHIGASAFGLKMGVILPGSNLRKLIMERVKVLDREGLIEDKDVLCVTESVVARSQNNYVTTEKTAAEIRDKLQLGNNKRVGVLFPILSRNRFSLILESIACSVPDGEVVIQLSYPGDEVGNRVIPDTLAEEIDNEHSGCMETDDLEKSYAHPITGVDYVRLYRDIVTEKGAGMVGVLCNNPLKILDYNPDAVMLADIHTKEKHRKIIAPQMANCCTLQDIFNKDNGNGRAWSEFGLLGSNMSSQNRLKLAPHQSDVFACELQEDIKKETGKNVEVIVYGDGAYKDPSSGIYELADPYPAFGATGGISKVLREGVKYKYLVDLYHDKGKSEEEIEQMLKEETAEKRTQDHINSEGTTPRQMEDVLASLADLVSGSADAGTPLVLIKGIFN